MFGAFEVVIMPLVLIDVQHNVGIGVLLFVVFLVLSYNLLMLLIPWSDWKVITFFNIPVMMYCFLS